MNEFYVFDTKSNSVCCTRSNGWWTKKRIEEDDISITSYAEYKKNIKSIITHLQKESDMTLNEILDMPFAFFMELVEEENKPKEKKSLISAFGG